MFILGWNIIEKILFEILISWTHKWLRLYVLKESTFNILMLYSLYPLKNRATTYRGVVDLCSTPYKYLHLLTRVLLFNGVTTLLYKHFITPFFYKSPLAHHLWCENQCVKNLSKNATRCDASYWPRCSLFSLKPSGWILCPPGWESCSRRVLLGVNGPVKVISRHLSACFYLQILILFLKPSFHALSIYFSSSYLFSNFPSFRVISTLRKHPTVWNEKSTQNTLYRLLSFPTSLTCSASSTKKIDFENAEMAERRSLPSHHWNFMDGVQHILGMGLEYCILLVGKIKRFFKIS